MMSEQNGFTVTSQHQFGRNSAIKGPHRVLVLHRQLGMETELDVTLGVGSSTPLRDVIGDFGLKVMPRLVREVVLLTGPGIKGTSFAWTHSAAQRRVDVHLFLAGA